MSGKSTPVADLSSPFESSAPAPVSPSAPAASSASLLEQAEERLGALRAEAAPLTEELTLASGVTLPPGFVPPPGFDPSAYKPVEAPAPVIPSVEDLMALGEAQVAAAQEAGVSGFEPWINNPTFEQDPEVVEVPESLPLREPAQQVTDPADPAPVYDLEAPAFVQAAQDMNITPAELARLLGGEEAQEDPAKPEPPTPEPKTLSPTEAALQARLEAMEKRFADLASQQKAEAEAQALAQQEAQLSQARADYEAQQRAAYEAQFEYLDDEAREALVEAKLEADLLRWDGQAALSQRQAQAQAQERETQESRRDATYAAHVEAMTKANPTMAIEIAPATAESGAYRLADFVADTHRAACDAYGEEAVGGFEPYSAAFAAAIREVQTKAVRHGISLAQAKQSKGNQAPPVLSNRGGGGPATKPPVATPDAIRPGQNQLFAHLRSPQTRR